ncbi:hypothetical protein F0562_015223, partial [Nyssa sinensis]
AELDIDAGPRAIVCAGVLCGWLLEELFVAVWGPGLDADQGNKKESQCAWAYGWHVVAELGRLGPGLSNQMKQAD